MGNPYNPAGRINQPVVNAAFLGKIGAMVRLMKFRHIAILLLLGATWAPGESFESAPAGLFTRIESAIGNWTAAEGNAQIHTGMGKSGNQCLRLAGEGERSVVLELSAAAEKGTVLSLQAERWTKRDPFQFRIDAKGTGDWQEIHQADKEVKVGGFHTEIRLTLPEGAREIRFRVTAPSDAGVLIDDVLVHRPGPAQATSVETAQPVCPAYIRQDFNPILGFRVTVEGSEGTALLEGIELGFGGTTGMDDIESFRIFAGQADPSADPGEVIVEGNAISEKISLSLKRELAAGEHWFWVSPVLKKNGLDRRAGRCLGVPRESGRQGVGAGTVITGRIAAHRIRREIAGG